MPNDNDEINIGGFLVKLGIAVVVIVAILVFAGVFYTIVPAGTVGVKDTLGVVDPVEFQPGFHLKNPLTGIIKYSTRAQPYIDYGQRDTITLNVLSNEGLDVSVEYAVVYRIRPDKADEIYKTVGIAYADIIMRQPIHSVPRDIISRYDAKTLYSANTIDSPDRLKIENSIREELLYRMNHDSDGNYVDRGIVIEQVALRNIQLPQIVTDAIQNKLSMEQQIAQKVFEVDKERAEADRKVAEATGIANSNAIISNSLTPEYLKWYWLQNLQNHDSTAYLQLGDDGFPVALTKEMVNG